MKAESITPILNVSDIQQSFEWFAKLGWSKGWEWGDPVTFGGVCSGEVEIFLCQNGQGGRGKGANKATFGDSESQALDQGVWLSVWVADVDTVYELCKQQNIDITWPPEDMPWNVREMHVRHPDGHVFRIGQSLPVG